MHAYQFYIDPRNIQGQTLLLEGDEWSHCCRVLRKQIGEIIQLVDGKGYQYEAKITEINKGYLQAIITKRETSSVQQQQINLGFGLVKHRALDQIIPNATVLGASDLTPLLSEYAVKQNFALDRYHKKAVEAMKQCGSALLPRISEPLGVEEWIEKNRDANVRLIAEQDGKQSMREIFKKGGSQNTIAAAVGPEGGFSATEIQQFQDHGFSVVNLLAPRLRSELAATVLLTQIQTLINGGNSL